MDRLIAELWPEAYRLSLAILRDPSLAEDCAQEACAKIARSLITLKDLDSFRAWAYRIVQHAAVSLGRRRRPTESLDTERHVTRESDAADRIDLERALGALPIEQRAVVVLHYYGGLTSEEIAGASGVKASTVRFRLMLARRSLQASLRLADAPRVDIPQGASHG